ncbi:ATP-binding cassette domain-containing protein [Mucilaginibacter lacusdianchii]|uniref:ATP-binding cassette domain-containing protein n=1 Tax=Mucilaginibacter lacusdianchii TaxID=2684211 RepID=UPI00131B0B66|nr:ATP-binding cassette domain-containing protein [Mucilaginibacter sp. JXJ CY 39]
MSDELMTPLLSIQKAVVKQSGKTILDNLSFTVQQGENWVLAGASGSGKTALLSVIAGRLPLNGGSIQRNFSIAHSQAKPIALVDTKHHFKNSSNTTDFYYQQRYNASESDEGATVREHLYAIEVSHVDGAYWTLDKVTERLMLTPLLDKQLIKLSNGETKRLLIASALMKNPVLLLLDNPLSGLDVQTRSFFGNLIDEITKTGITVIMSANTHELPKSITHVALLEQGAIISTSPIADFQWPEPISEELSIDKDKISFLVNVANKETFRDIVKLHKVNVKYGDNQILNNVDWHIKQGEHWALLGPNGAGKSTLLSLINGDNPQAYANDIILFDRKRGTGESIWDIKRKTGYISPELFQYFPSDSSGLQVIESGFYDTLGLFRPSQPAKQAVAMQWMDVLEIQPYARQLLKNMPASAQRLCLLARALVKNPPLLILDEPTQGLDEQQRQHFKNLIDTICSISPITLIYVTHYQEEIPNCVDQVLRLDKGNVVN